MELFEEIRQAIQSVAPVYAGAGGMVLADGPLPFGDAVGLVIAGVTTIGVAGYATYKTIAEPKVVAKEKAEPITKVPPKQNKYWTATKDAKPILEISYPTAVATVKAGRNIIQPSAYAVAKWFPNSFYEGPHDGGAEEYYPHYHINERHGPPHIWFYCNP